MYTLFSSDIGAQLFVNALYIQGKNSDNTSIIFFYTVFCNSYELEVFSNYLQTYELFTLRMTKYGPSTIEFMVHLKID